MDFEEQNSRKFFFSLGNILLEVDFYSSGIKKTRDVRDEVFLEISLSRISILEVNFYFSRMEF